MSKYTIKQFQAEYPDDEACLDKVLEMRYGGKEFDCPGCGVESKFHRISKRRAYACQQCGHHVYPCVGTPFERSRTPLSDWFLALYLFTSSRHGVAAKEIQRQIGCTYKTAWRMCHELRKLMVQADDHDPMSGHIEIDESYVGGRRRGRKQGFTGRGAKGKTIVFGMLERKVRCARGRSPMSGAKPSSRSSPLTYSAVAPSAPMNSRPMGNCANSATGTVGLRTRIRNMFAASTTSTRLKAIGAC